MRPIVVRRWQPETTDSATALAGLSGKAPETPTENQCALFPNPSALDCLLMRVVVPRERTTTKANDDVKNSKADMARSRATTATDTSSNKDKRTMGRSKGVVGERPLHVARSPQLSREHLRTDCKHYVQRHAKKSYHPQDHATNPDPNSVPIGGLPTVFRFVRSLGLPVVRLAVTRTDQRRTEGVSIFHDQRFSRKGGKTLP